MIIKNFDDLTGLVKENFPNLLLCDVLDFGAPIEESFYGAYAEEIAPWFKWNVNFDKPVSWLRVKTTQSNHLIIKHLTGKKFMTVLSKNENIPFLISFLMGLSGFKLQVEGEQETETADKTDLKLQDAVRIQQMIMPREDEIKTNFKDFFLVLQQQDLVGGDFYWYRKIGNQIQLAVVDCTGHSIEGAMASMVCNSLLNQCSASNDPTDLEGLVSDFYKLLIANNGSAKSDQLDYGIGAELGVFCFDFDKKEIHFTSSGIAAFIKTEDGIELQRSKKVIDYELIHKILNKRTFSMEDVKGVYAFTDGLTDQFDSTDAKKLGYKGLQEMIENESGFGSEYYAKEIEKWKGGNIQYDDITLLGLAI